MTSFSCRISHLFSSVRSFGADKTGAVAIVFGLAAIPVAGLVGASIDYSRVSNIRATYQGAADAAALAAATSGLNSFEAKEDYARAVFTANIPLHGHQLGRVDLYDGSLGYEVRATGTMETTLLGVLGVDGINLGVSATAVAASDPLEISIVVDATNSMMQGSRWRTAYDSLENVLTALDEAIVDRESFKATVVPMGDRINISTARTGWIDGFEGQDASDADEHDNRGRGGHWNDEEREGEGDNGRRGWRDGDDDDGEEGISQDDWTGCVVPREEATGGNPYLLTDANPAELPFAPHDHTRVTALHTDRMYHCPVAIIGPSADVDDIMTGVSGIRAAGTGRFDEGLAWGWRTVSSNWTGEWGLANYPAQPGDARKVVVFISDGNSTMEDHEFDGHSEWGWNNSGRAHFDSFAAVCEQMKDQGITIYTFYIEGNPYADEYFLACASSPAHYFDVTRDEDMVSAFESMGAGLLQARLVR